ncbi:MAG: urease accessory protein UreD [Alphaproteobacteria bacterium]|nr:urease accessory protein UreD [Alphaproteobacteria bacterium]
MAGGRRRVRVDGGARVTLRDDAGTTRLVELWHHDPMRVLLPEPVDDEIPHVVLLNTAGGLVGGDSLRTAIGLGDRARALVTGQAAEKVYRSDGPDVAIRTSLSAGRDAWLEWMPQETILFEASRLDRGLAIDLAAGARCLAGETLVFGRRARGETIARAWLRDRWEIRREGRLAWADAFALRPDEPGALDAPFALDGAAAMATLAYCGADAPARLEGLREALAGHGAGIAASCLGDILLVRGLSRDAQALRRAVAEAWRFLRAAGGSLPARLPRLWHI